MTGKYVNETSTLAPRSEFQMYPGAMWQLKAQIIIMRMVFLNCPNEIVDYLTLGRGSSIYDILITE